VALHHQIDWITSSDRSILLALPPDYWIKADSLCLNVPFTRQTVARRCRELADHGVLERHPEKPAYRRTELATRIVNDEVDAEELQSN